MPWIPELFSASALARIWEDERRRRLELVPFFPGVMTGEIGALVESFAGEPELHHPVRGRVKGAAAFVRFVEDTRAWLDERAAAVTDVDFVLMRSRGVEELVLHLDGGDGRIGLPVAVASDHDERGRITEQRLYFSGLPLTGRHAIRPPVLQPVDGLELPGIVGDHQRALVAGDVDAVLAAFEPDGRLREPDGRICGAGELRALYERRFSDGGGTRQEHCAVTVDDHAAALEYNVVARGPATLPPQAGLAVYVRGAGGKLAEVRIYDDAGP
jgi:SnoaL-like protein